MFIEKQYFTIALKSKELIGLNGKLMPFHIFHLRRHLAISVFKIEPRHEISNNVVCVTSKGSDQPAHTCRLIRAFAGHLIIL